MRYSLGGIPSANKDGAILLDAGFPLLYFWKNLLKETAFGAAFLFFPKKYLRNVKAPVFFLDNMV